MRKTVLTISLTCLTSSLASSDCKLISNQKLFLATQEGEV